MNERWAILSMNVLGDPEMSVFTESPHSFGNVAAGLYNDTLVTYTNGINNFDLSCHVFGTNNEEYYYSFKNLPTTYYINEISSDSMIITFHKKNYFPIQKSICNGIYIQNTILEQTPTLQTNRLFVGHDVAPWKTRGNVIVSSSNSPINLKASKEVYIKNGFSVPLGSNITITIE